MYSNPKIPEPFCRGASPVQDPAPRAEKPSSAEKTQPAEARQDAMPLLAFLLMEYFR